MKRECITYHLSWNKHQCHENTFHERYKRHQRRNVWTGFWVIRECCLMISSTVEWHWILSVIISHWSDCMWQFGKNDQDQKMLSTVVLMLQNSARPMKLQLCTICQGVSDGRYWNFLPTTQTSTLYKIYVILTYSDFWSSPRERRFKTMTTFSKSSWCGSTDVILRFLLCQCRCSGILMEQIFGQPWLIYSNNMTRSP